MPCFRGCSQMGSHFYFWLTSFRSHWSWWFCARVVEEKQRKKNAIPSFAVNDLLHTFRNASKSWEQHDACQKSLVAQTNKSLVGREIMFKQFLELLTTGVKSSCWLFPPVIYPSKIFQVPLVFPEFVYRRSL